MPSLRAVATLDGVRVGTRALPLRDSATEPWFITKAQLAGVVGALPAATAAAAAAAAALAALPDGPLVGLLATSVGRVAVTAGSVPLSLTGVGACSLSAGGTTLQPVPAGTLIALPGAAARLGVRVEEAPAPAPPPPAQVSNKRAAPEPAPPPPPLQVRSALHKKAVAALAASSSAARAGPLAGARIALLDADPVQQRAACFAAGLGAAIAWLAPDEPLTAWPASQTAQLGGSAGTGLGAAGGDAAAASTPYTHIVAHDPASGSAKARLRDLGLLPPRVVPPPTKPSATQEAGTATATQAPPPSPPPAWAPPPGAPFVVGAAWLHDCNKKKCILDAGSYSVAWRKSTLKKEAGQAGLLAADKAAASPPAAKKTKGNSGGGAAAAASTPGAAPAAGAPTPPPTARPPAGPARPPLPLPPPAPCSPDTACALMAAAAGAYARYGTADQVGAATANGHAVRTGRIVTWTSTALRPRPGGLPPAAGLKWTGGASGVPWGTRDVWLEPFDPAAVQETLGLLYRHWMPSRKKTAAAAAGPSSRGGGGGGGGGGYETDELTDDDEDNADLAPGGRLRLNGVCGHAACAGRPYCIVVRLREAADTLYSKSSEEGAFFKGRSLRVGIDAVAAWPTPLRTRADVDALVATDKGGMVKGLGPKTLDKIWEFVSTGRMVRVDMARADPLAVATKELTRVWGVGDAAAAKWVARGILSVNDLRAQAALPGGGLAGSLTLAQRLGLEHFEDFCSRIPALEVDAVVEAAREVAFEVMGCDGRGYPPGADPATTAPAHVRACGSWLRAHAATDIPAAAAGLAAARQADYGDVDLLIIPPSPAEPPLPPTSPASYTAAVEAATRDNHALLRRVLEGLAARGFETEGVNTDSWFEPSGSRVRSKVGRSTYADAHASHDNADAWFKHLGAGDGADAVPGAPSSWMGGVRLPADHPALRAVGDDAPRPRRWRRMDLKVYSYASRACAVAYFTGDGSFNRALRLWAKKAPAARKSALEAAGPGSGATGWHLSDQRLFPIAQHRWQDKNASRRPVGPPAVLACESDIFKALGLAYVPPFCRTFTRRADAAMAGFNPA